MARGAGRRLPLGVRRGASGRKTSLAACSALVLGLLAACRWGISHGSSRSLANSAAPDTAFVGAPSTSGPAVGRGAHAEQGRRLDVSEDFGRREFLAGVGLAGAWESQARSAQALANDQDGPVFTLDGIADRVLQYKQFGLRESGGNLAARAFLADGSCRITADEAFDGYAFWHANPSRVDPVLKVLRKLPKFTKDDNQTDWANAAKEALRPVCKIDPLPDDKTNSLKLYDNEPEQKVRMATSFAQDWYKSVCAMTGPDPAEEAQQQALDIGFICVMVCDAAGKKLPASSMAKFRDTKFKTQDIVDKMCSGLPWSLDSGPAKDLSGINSWNDFASATEVWRKPCGCQ